MSTVDGVAAWVLDVDGCLVRTSRAGGSGGALIPGAVDLMTHLHAAGQPVVVCTNASEYPPAHYADHLRTLGLPIIDDEFVTAGSAGADHVAAFHPGAQVVALGGEGITEPLRARGLELYVDGDPTACAAVLVGAGQSYTQQEINAACLAIDAGAAFYVTQDGPWFHGGQGRSVAISGAIAAAIAWVTGAAPQVTGKPSPVLAQSLVRRLERPAEQIAVVGDARAEIRLAREIGGVSVAVLSGALDSDQVEALRADAPGAAPDRIVQDVGALHHLVTSRPVHTSGATP